MKEEIKIPQMGESVTEATISAFLKTAGSSVKENEEIVELETEKVNQVLYAPIAGVLSWNVKEGDSVKIGQVIGIVESGKEAEKGPAEKPKEEKKIPPEKTEPERKAPEISDEKPTGKGQRVMLPEFVEEIKKPSEEILTTAKEKKKMPAPDGEEIRRPMTKIRKTIAARLVKSLHTAAMLTTFNEADMSAIMALRERHQAGFTKKHDVKLGFMSFFVKAVVEGLKSFPELNSYIDNDEMVTRQYYDIGIAVATEKGLVVPIVRKCDVLSFADIEKEISRYAQRAREGKLTIDDLQGGGFTITNGGVYGSMLSTPILNPPQSGILGMHKITKRAVVVEDAIVIRPIMYLALSYDHRIVDGKEAVSFLVKVKEVLEDPSSLMFTDGDGQL
jgi:2-oxoglutarate dehydrogenase E2 component (dihydrolipoamide succinyltransferase)